MKYELQYELELTQHPQALQVMKVNMLSVFVSSLCFGDVVTIVSHRHFICCVSHGIFIRVGLQRVGGDQVLSGL